MNRSDDIAEALAVEAERTRRHIAHIVGWLHDEIARCKAAEQAAPITGQPAPTASQSLDGVLRQLAGGIPTQRSSES